MMSRIQIKHCKHPRRVTRCQPFRTSAIPLLCFALLQPIMSTISPEFQTSISNGKDQKREFEYDRKSKPILRKSVSYDSKMNQEVGESDPQLSRNHIGKVATRSKIYTPVHSSGHMSLAELPRSRNNLPSTSSLYHLLASEEQRRDDVKVYTRLQTQLFPDFRF